MSRPDTDALIAALGAEAVPVRPLRPPLTRALIALAAIALFGAAAVLLLSNGKLLVPVGAAGPAMSALELAATLATGVLAIIGAFFLSVPGRSRRWALAPIAPAALWIGLSGLGCYRDLLRTGSTGLEIGHSGDCLVFIVGASLLIGLPLLWRLSRARPIDPLPVALLGGLGTAALAALLLQFFHPFAVTFVDLGFHLAAVMTVVALAAALRRPMLRPA